MSTTTVFALGVIEFIMGGICFLIAAKLIHECKDSPELKAWKQARRNVANDTEMYDLEYWSRRQTQELIKSRLIDPEETNYMR